MGNGPSIRGPFRRPLGGECFVYVLTVVNRGGELMTFVFISRGLTAAHRREARQKRLDKSRAVWK